jgi:hypothetical protein
MVKTIMVRNKAVAAAKSRNEKVVRDFTPVTRSFQVLRKETAGPAVQFWWLRLLRFCLDLGKTKRIVIAVSRAQYDPGSMRSTEPALFFPKKNFSESGGWLCTPEVDARNREASHESCCSAVRKSGIGGLCNEKANNEEVTGA